MESSLFARLPAELRNDVYELVLGEITSIDIRTFKKATGLIQTCRQIRQEARAMMLYRAKYLMLDAVSTSEAKRACNFLDAMGFDIISRLPAIFFVVDSNRYFSNKQSRAYIWLDLDKRETTGARTLLFSLRLPFSVKGDDLDEFLRKTKYPVEPDIVKKLMEIGFQVVVKGKAPKRKKNRKIAKYAMTSGNGVIFKKIVQNGSESEWEVLDGLKENASQVISNTTVIKNLAQDSIKDSSSLMSDLSSQPVITRKIDQVLSPVPADAGRKILKRLLAMGFQAVVDEGEKANETRRLYKGTAPRHIRRVYQLQTGLGAMFSGLAAWTLGWLYRTLEQANDKLAAVITG